jgi:hypothetical protein
MQPCGGNRNDMRNVADDAQQNSTGKAMKSGGYCCGWISGLPMYDWPEVYSL